MINRVLKISVCMLVALCLVIAGFLIGTVSAQSLEDIDEARARCDKGAFELSNIVGVGTTAYFDRLAIGLFLRRDLPMDPGVAEVLDCYKPITVVITFGDEVVALSTQSTRLHGSSKAATEGLATDDPIGLSESKGVQGEDFTHAMN